MPKGVENFFGPTTAAAISPAIAGSSFTRTLEVSFQVNSGLFITFHASLSSPSARNIIREFLPKDGSEYI